MFNFFHSIIVKIAVGISSVALFFSGSVTTPPLVPQNATSSTQIEIVATSSTTAAATQKTETSAKQDTPKDSKDSLIGSLKKQVADLTQKASQPKVETPKTSVVTLPSGAVVEMDADGNVIRTITAAPQQTYTAPAPKISSSELQDGLAKFYAQFSLSSVQSGIPQLLGILSSEQTLSNNATQQRALCVSTYNSQVAYFQQQGQNALTSAQESQRGFAVNTGAIASIKAQTQMQLDNLKTTEDACLASHPDTSSSMSQQISQITTQLNQLQSRVQASPTSVSEITSILQDYNSLYGQVLAVYGINSTLQSASAPSRVPSSGSFSCSSQGGYFNCNGAGVSTSCSSLSPNSLNCSSTNGQNISCTAQGGYVNCSY